MLEHLLVLEGERHERRQRCLQRQVAGLESDAGIQQQALAESGVAAGVEGEHVRAFVVIGERVAAANDGVPPAADELRQEAVLLRHRRPGESDVGCEVVVVGVVGVLALLELEVLRGRGLARQRSRLEDVTAVARGIDTRDAADVFDRRRRVAVVLRGERELQRVAQAGVDREIRPPAPGILDEEAGLLHLRTLQANADVLVLTRRFVQTRVRLDLGHAAGQERVEILRLRELRTRRGHASGRLQRRGGDHLLRGIRRQQAGRQARHERRVLRPDIEVRPRHPAGHVVVALQPGDRVLDRQVGRVARLRTRVGARARQIRADVGELDVEPLLVRERSGVHRHAHLVEELDRRAAVADTRFVDQVAPQRRTNRVRPAHAHGRLAAEPGEPGPLRVEIVQRVWRVGEPVVVPRTAEPMVLGQVVVDAGSREAALRLHRHVVAELVDVRVEVVDLSRGGRRTNVAE